MDSECIIWQSPADGISEIGKDGSAFDSPRAGGKYFITGTAMSGLKELSNGQKALLTSWLVEQRRNGGEIPTISSTTIAEIRNRRAQRFSQKSYESCSIARTTFPKLVKPWQSILLNATTFTQTC